MGCVSNLAIEKAVLGCARQVLIDAVGRVLFETDRSLIPFQFFFAVERSVSLNVLYGQKDTSIMHQTAANGNYRLSSAGIIDQRAQSR